MDDDRRVLRADGRQTARGGTQSSRAVGRSRLTSPTQIAGELAALGPFFAADVHRPGDVVEAPWRPVRELVDDPHVLAERVARVRTALAGNRSPTTVELRVAASVAQLGIVARLIAPAIATAAVTSEHVAIIADDCWWQDQLGGPFPLSIAPRTNDQPVDVIAGVIESITTITIATYGVPARSAWGNVGSAVNSAAQMIASSRPDYVPRAHEAADTILADRRIEAGALRSGPGYRRTSCCLIYRLAAERSAICGDCVLHR